MDAIEARVRHVCALEKGWYDKRDGYDGGASIDINPEQVLRVIRALMAQGFDQPTVNPTPEGLVELEWRDGLSLEVHA